MDIISKNHFKIINEINLLTNHKVFYGGSLEDFLLLGYAEKPIGDLDILIYGGDTIEIIKDRYELSDSKPSYFNNFMNEKFIKYNVTLYGIKIDFLVSDSDPDLSNITHTVRNGYLINHRTFEYKKEILKEWIRLSVPDDMWAHDKFSLILEKYENFNYQ